MYQSVPIAAAAQDAPTPVVLATGFIPNVQFAPYYLAQDRGYYADEGLDVTIQNGANANALAQVGSGGIDFAITGGDALVPGGCRSPGGLRHGPVSKVPRRRHGHRGQRPTAQLARRSPRAAIGVSGPNGSTYIAMRALLQAGA